ncbi:hypothetical protein HN873_062991 [Arachis hypogaea]
MEHLTQFSSILLVELLGFDLNVWFLFLELVMLSKELGLWQFSSQLYEYQYNMGLLLIEKKEWSSKYNELNQDLAEVKDALEREKSAHLITIFEAEKREEHLRKALGVEKECVLDLEKVVREMRSEHANIKFSAESKKSSEIDRKSHDLESQEALLRRDRLSLIADQEAHESTLSKQREDLREWEKKLQEGEEKLAKDEHIGKQCDSVDGGGGEQGTAYIHGKKHASGNFVVIMDADLSHHESESESPPSETPQTMDPRGYQLEVFEVAKKRNTIAVLDTGAGKTLIAVLLMKNIGQAIRSRLALLFFIDLTLFFVSLNGFGAVVSSVPSSLAFFGSSLKVISRIPSNSKVSSGSFKIMAIDEDKQTDKDRWKGLAYDISDDQQDITRGKGIL